ncbi:MAG: hypothetical protein ACRD3V_21000, partial [Vicinamibacteria bacterium]
GSEPSEERGEHSMMSRVVVHVFLERFLQACRGRDCDDLLSVNESLSALLARYGSGWWKPSADEAVLVSHRPWEADDSPLGWGSSLRERISNELQLDCSIGIASTRLAARICARLACPNGILLWMPGHERSLIGEMPLEELDELRPAQMERLRSEGIRTLSDMAGLSPGRARALMGTEGERVVALVRGVDASLDRAEGGRLFQAATLLARRLSRRLERGGRRARGLELMIVYADGVTRERYIVLPGPTSRSADFSEGAMRLAASTDERRESVVGISLTATGLTSFSGQLDLFCRVPAQEVRVALGRVDLVRPVQVDTGRSQSICSPHTLGGLCP